MKALVLSAVMVLFGAASLAAQQDDFMVLEGGTLIDGRGGPPLGDAVVVVRGDRIWAVGRRGQVPIPEGANVIETTGRTILPGLIDMHLHSYPWKFPMYLAYGVTTVGDIHANTPWIIAQRALLRSGGKAAPASGTGKRLRTGSCARHVCSAPAMLALSRGAPCSPWGCANLRLRRRPFAGARRAAG